MSGPPRLRILTVHTATGLRVMARCSLPHVVGMALCFCHVSNAWAVLPRQTRLCRATTAAGFWSSAQVSLGGSRADLSSTAHSRKENVPQAYPDRGFRTNLNNAGSLIQSESKICYYYEVHGMLGCEAWLFQGCYLQRVLLSSTRRIPRLPTTYMHLLVHT